MQQNEDVANELHDFNDIEPRSLRDYNRGAVLANIHDKYVVEGKIASRAMENWLKELQSYLSRIPVAEVGSAKDAMKLHLQKRDVIYG